METLRRLLLVVVIATSLMLAPTKPPAYAAPQPPPISYQQAVVEKFANAAGGEVVYRRGWHAGGGSGFGYDKITRKHGINNVQIVRAVVRYPQVTRQETQTRWVQEKQALLMGLSVVSQTLTVRVVIEYGGWAGPGQLGVVTAYCVGIQGRCPDRVNRAFADSYHHRTVRTKEPCRVAYESLPFRSLDQEWAADVARRVHGLALASEPAPRVDEVWVSTDLALQVRYHVGASALAVRFGHLDTDPVSPGAPSDSARLASDLFHNLHAAPDNPPWHDALGYGWWGDEPKDGWPTVPDRERILTLP